MSRSWRFNRVSKTAMICLSLLFLPGLAIATGPVIELEASNLADQMQSGDRFDYEYNTTGIIDEAPTHISTPPIYSYVTACIENDTGEWLRLRHMSFPASQIMRGPDWRWGIWTEMGVSGPPSGPPASADIIGFFPPPTDIFTYTVIPLNAYEIIIPPGEFFSVGYGCDMGHAGLYKVPSADTYRWDGKTWTSVEGEGYTVVLQVMADFIDLSNILVFPDGSGLFSTIQEAIDAVDEGGTVSLANGLFEGSGNYRLDFRGKDLTLRSISENPKTCIIDCYDGPRGSGYGNGITFDKGEGPGAVVEGITFINGIWESGAGIEIMGSSPTIRNCVFENGLCLGGGGIFIDQGAPEIIDCVFSNGHADVIGGGIYGTKCSASINYSRFEGNYAGMYGGAIYLAQSPAASIDHCVFYDNDGKSGGGGLLLDQSPLTVTHCTFSENQAMNGSGIYMVGDGPNIWMSIIAYGNSQSFFCDQPTGLLPELVCCDIFGNLGGDWVGCIASQMGVDGNFNENPKFCGELGTGIFTIEEESPCAPDGNLCGLFIGALDVDCEGTSTAATSWSSLKQLY